MLFKLGCKASVIKDSEIMLNLMRSFERRKLEKEIQL